MANPYLEKAKSTSAAKLQRMTGKSEGAQPHTGGKAGEMEEAASMSKAHDTKKKKVAKRAEGGKVVGSKSKPRLDKFARGGAVPKKAEGGKVKKGTTININVAPKGGAPGEAASGAAAAPPPPPPEAMLPPPPAPPPAPPPEATAPPPPPEAMAPPPAVPPIDQTPPGMPPAAGAPPEIVPGLPPENLVALIKTMTPDQLALLPPELVMTLEQAGIIPPGGGVAGGAGMAPPPPMQARGGRIPSFKKGGKVAYKGLKAEAISDRKAKDHTKKPFKKADGGKVPHKRFGGGDEWPINPPPVDEGQSEPSEPAKPKYEMVNWQSDPGTFIMMTPGGKGSDHPLHAALGDVPEGFPGTDDEYYRLAWDQKQDRDAFQWNQTYGKGSDEITAAEPFTRQMYPVRVNEGPPPPPDDPGGLRPDEPPTEDVPTNWKPPVPDGPPEDLPTNDLPIVDGGVEGGPLGLGRYMLADGGEVPEGYAQGGGDDFKKGDFYIDPLEGRTPDPKDWPSREEILMHNKYVGRRSNPAEFGVGMFGLAGSKDPWKNAYIEGYNLIPLPEPEFWNDPKKLGFPDENAKPRNANQMLSPEDRHAKWKADGTYEARMRRQGKLADGGEVPEKRFGGGGEWPIRPPKPDPGPPDRVRGANRGLSPAARHAAWKADGTFAARMARQGKGGGGSGVRLPAPPPAKRPYERPPLDKGPPHTMPPEDKPTNWKPPVGDPPRRQPPPVDKPTNELPRVDGPTNELPRVETPTPAPPPTNTLPPAEPAPMPPPEAPNPVGWSDRAKNKGQTVGIKRGGKVSKKAIGGGFTNALPRVSAPPARNVPPAGGGLVGGGRPGNTNPGMADPGAAGAPNAGMADPTGGGGQTNWKPPMGGGPANPPGGGQTNWKPPMGRQPPPVSGLGNQQAQVGGGPANPPPQGLGGGQTNWKPPMQGGPPENAPGGGQTVGGQGPGSTAPAPPGTGGQPSPGTWQQRHAQWKADGTYDQRMANRAKRLGERPTNALPRVKRGGIISDGSGGGMGRLQKAGIASRISPKKPSKSGTIGAGGNQLVNKSRVAGRQVGGGKKGIIARANKINK